MWVTYSSYTEKIFQELSSNLFSQSAQRIQLENWDEDEILIKYLDEDGILYCDNNEINNLKGIFLKDRASFNIPIMEGKFFGESQFDDERVAVVGKGIVSNAINRNGEKYIKIGNFEYKIVGVMGVKTVVSSVDYMTLISIDNLKETLGSDEPLFYTIDGYENDVQATLQKMDEVDIKYSKVMRQSVGLDTLYSNGNDSVVTNFCLILIITLVLILFVFLEIYTKKKEVRIYQINGATTFQILILLLKKHMIAKYLALSAGMAISYVVLSLIYNIMYSIVPFLFLMIVSFILITLCIYFTSMAIQKSTENQCGKKKLNLALRFCFVLTVIAASLTLIFSNMLVSTYESQLSAHKTFSDITSKQYYNVISNCSGQELDRAIFESNFLQRVKKLYSEMSSDDNYPYYSFSMQPIKLPKANLPNHFSYSGQGGPITAIQVGSLFFSCYEIEFESGSEFKEEHYNGDDKNEMPVILGNGYNEMYSVGDTIADGQYLSKDYEFKVVGILKENTYYINQGNTVLADYTVVMPAITYNDNPIQDTEEWIHQIALYTGHITGLYALNDETEFIGLNTWLQSLVKQNGIYPLGFIGIPLTSSLFLQSVSEEYIATTTIMTISFMVLLFALFAQMSYLIFFSKRHYYEVMKICGASINQISFSICKNIVNLSILANVFSFAVTKLFIDINYSWMLFVISNAAVILISLLYMRSILKKDFVG